MRYPDAIWRPTEKHGYGDFDTHSQEGVVIHSAEGSLAGALSVLDGPRQASWHFFITTVGRIYQHVDTDQIAWTNGSYDANKLWWGIECEGREGEALTELQYQALVRVVRWLWATHQVGAPVRQETLWEHREMTRFGSPSTSCPSGRIPWAALINEWEEDMAFTEDEIRAMARNEVIDVFDRFFSDTSDKRTLRYLLGQLNAHLKAEHGSGDGVSPGEVRAIAEDVADQAVADLSVTLPVTK